MCLAIPGKVIKADSRKATVKYTGKSRTVLTGGENVKIGDHVMVQMGIIVKILSSKEIQENQKIKHTTLPILSDADNNAEK